MWLTYFRSNIVENSIGTFDVYSLLFFHFFETKMESGVYDLCFRIHWSNQLKSRKVSTQCLKKSEYKDQGFRCKDFFKLLK
jgi:hypothetical protein